MRRSLSKHSVQVHAVACTAEGENHRDDMRCGLSLVDITRKAWLAGDVRPW